MEQKVDLFTSIHKAIRALFYDTGKLVQTTNLTDPQDREFLLQRLEYMLSLLEEHGKHEDDLIFPQVEKAASGITTEVESQHHACEERAAQLQELIRHIRETSNPGELAILGTSLNRAYTEFMAHHLLHMNCEEQTVLPASKQNLSNEELTTIRLQIQMSIAPERYTEWLKWMLPALPITELKPLFSQVKASAPAPVYEKFRQIGEKYMDEKRWHQLQSI